MHSTALAGTPIARPCLYTPQPYLERRDPLVPGLRSPRIYIIDIKPDAIRPPIAKVIEPRFSLCPRRCVGGCRRFFPSLPPVSTDICGIKIASVIL